MSRIDEAFEVIDRVDFLPEDVQAYAALDGPLPIGFGQTNSQPSTVRWMLEWLDAHRGDRVLDVGSGSGWTSALLAHIVGDEGRVDAVECVPELVGFGRENCKKYGFTNVTFHQAGADFGLPEKAPFDRILVSASAAELPSGLLNQMAPRGKIVIPVGHSILEIIKQADGTPRTIKHEGFLFVPLV